MPSLDDLMTAAVGGVGGTPREGQQAMATAVAEAASTGEHLLVQAGTGTGKSLAYLVPAIDHAQRTGRPVVVATATLALQSQIVDRDLPRLAEALTPHLRRQPTYALVKGRRNYVCAHKLEGGFPDEPESLFGVGEADAAAGRLGREVVRLREWAAETESGDRDELVPGVSEKAWRQVSVSAEECLGSRCPMVAECFVERSREAAKEVDVIVTNHSFMAIDAFEERRMLPEHDLLVVDEAHELTERVTSTITDEITAPGVRSAASKAGSMIETSDGFEDAAVMLEAALAGLPEGRLATGLPDALALGLTRVRDVARGVISEITPDKGGDLDGARQVALAAVSDLFDTAGRILEERQLDVVWVGHDQRRGSVLRVAPMSVAMLVRDRIFGAPAAGDGSADTPRDRTVVLTSATLELGGTFDAVAGTIGLRGDDAPEWRGLDVGSPFDYPGQGIAYVAAHLPPPGRDGLAPATLDEIESLVRAAGGRTLGLFSSRRAAEQAAEEMRGRLGEDYPVLCQGEDQIGTLVRQFARDARTCLFGTLTLWQGVDVPGSSCQLVLIDRIPFPRPDDPLSSARSEAIKAMGGNGFMAVSATHAALRLAQGAGRLIRRGDDRGVVAFLDPRMMTARYAGFLQRSLPPFWPTTDQSLALGALQRLDQLAPDVQDVADPAKRGLTGAASIAAAPAGSAAQQRAADGSDHPRPIAVDPPPPTGARSGVTAGQGWSAAEDETLRLGAAQDGGAEALAQQLDRDLPAVQARLAALGLIGD